MQDIWIHIGMLSDGYVGVDITLPRDVEVRTNTENMDDISDNYHEIDPGYEVDPVKPRDDEDEGILYDNLD